MNDRERTEGCHSKRIENYVSGQAVLYLVVQGLTWFTAKNIKFGIGNEKQPTIGTRHLWMTPCLGYLGHV